MATKVWNNESAYMDRSDYSSEDDYRVYGTGNLKNCKTYISNRKSWNQLYIHGKFDLIEDGCFSHDSIRMVYFCDGGSFKRLGNECFRSTKLDTITLPETLESIGHNNFNGVFTSFNIPVKITDFPADNLKDCHNLKTITVSEGNTAYKIVDGILYNYDLTEIIFCPNSRTGTVNIPNTVKRIGDYCFYGCKNLKMIFIPTSVESIGDYAFSEFQIDKLVIPNSVKTIGNGTFCKTTITSILKLSSQISAIPFNAFAQSNIKKFQYAYRNTEAFGASSMQDLKTQILPEIATLPSLKKIGIQAFNNCKGTRCFEFFSCIESIEAQAFINCNEELKLRFFLYGPIRINKDAFVGLTDKATLIVPKGTKTFFTNTAPWCTINNIVEQDLNIDQNVVVTEVSDETHSERLKSVADSKAKADRYYLKEIIEDLCLNYQYVDSDEEYDEALSVIAYNRSFSPAIIQNLEQKMCQSWTNKYKLKLISRAVLDNPASPLVLTQENTTPSVPVADNLALPVVDVVPALPQAAVTKESSIQVFFNEEILKQVQDTLSIAHESVKIAVSWFTNYSLFKQVKEMAKVGSVKVQLITNNDLTNNGGYCLNLNELIDTGVEISLVEYPHLLHDKFFIVDDQIVVNGSYNWTRFSAKNYENITVIRGDEEVIRQFNEEFERLLNNAEYKNIDKMPDTVPERPEYDRGAFRQYVTEELDAEARETSDERDKITALQKAVNLNAQYMQKLNPTAVKQYANEIKVVDDSVLIQKSIVSMVEDKPTESNTQQPIASSANSNEPASANTASATQPQSSVTEPAALQTPTTPSAPQAVPVTTPAPQPQSSNTPSATKPVIATPSAPQVVSNAEKEVIKQVAASSLVMVLDVSSSMSETYRSGHVHALTQKALSASMAISESKEVAIWTFGDDASFFGNIGVDKIDDIQKINYKNDCTYLNKFVSKADSSIKDGALVIIFTDDDQGSIQNAINGMKQRSKVFWQIIVCGSNSTCIEKAIQNVDNTSVVSLTDYASKTDDEISKILLKDYIAWKKKNM